MIQELSRKEKDQVNELVKSIIAIKKSMKSLGIPEEILEKEVKPFGNASHIILPKEYTRKKARVILSK
ncbi:hypothetical protein A3K73_07780 [Candidatus Pacearchaeota archaeon RBG_13_36_9]|nr:MAG: hypothetical protein A3K73_07780 [Candidatus Pacearchaeota archaeon RBG_13_36_9]